MTIIARALRRLPTAALAAIGITATASAAGAQANFDWPAADTTFSSYTSPEQCVAAAMRVANLLAWETRSDTAIYNGSAPLPDQVVRLAHDCGSRFTVANTPEKSQMSLLQLYLMMGRTEEVQQLVRQRLDALPAKDVMAQATARSMLVAWFLQARPALVEPARALAREIDGMGSRARMMRVTAHSRLYEHARSIMDTDVMIAEGNALIAAADGLSDQEWMSEAIQETIADAVISTTLPMLRDSTAAGYLAALESRMRQALGDSYGTRGAGSIGAEAQPLAGDFWFGRADSTVALPAPGRISIVMKVDHRCQISCFESFAVLKRLEARYGDDLDVTLVGRTAGYYWLRPPLTPAEEATAMNEFFLGKLQLPGALTVSTTPFVRRPDPDGRRVDKPVQNDTTYALSPNNNANSIAVTDERGTIVYYTASLRARKERELTATLDFLIARKRAGVASHPAGAAPAGASPSTDP